METNDSTTQDHLIELRRAQHAAAGRMRSQAWFHPLFGLLTGGFIVVWALVATGTKPFVAALFAVSMAVVGIVYDRRVGIRASVWRHPAVLAWSAVAGLVLLLAVIASAVVMTVGLPTAVAVTGIVAMGLAVAATMVALSLQVERSGLATLDAGQPGATR